MIKLKLVREIFFKKKLNKTTKSEIDRALKSKRKETISDFLSFLFFKHRFVVFLRESAWLL